MAGTTFTPFPRLPTELRCAIWQEAVPARILRVNIRGYGSPETLDAWFEFVDESDFSRHGNPVWDLMKVCREAYVEVRRALPDRALVAVPKPKKKGFALAWLPVSLSRDQFCVRDVLTVAKYLFNSLEREGNDIAVVPPLHTIAVEPQLVVGGGGSSGPQGIALGDQIMYTAAFLGAQRVYLLRWEPYYKNQSPQSLSPLAMLDNIPNLGQHQPEAVRAHYSHLLQAADKAVEEEEEEAWSWHCGNRVQSNISREHQCQATLCEKPDFGYGSLPR